MKLTFYSHDVSPGTKMLPKLAEEAGRRGHEAVHPPAQVAEVLTGWSDRIRGSAAGVFSPSSNKTEMELAVRDALGGDAATIFVADTKGALLRPKAQAIVPAVDGALVAFEEDIEPAVRFGYKNVRYRGIPPHIGDDYAAMGRAAERRKSFRKKRGDEEATIADDDVLLSLHGNKTSPDWVNAAVKAVRDAGQARYGDKLVLAVREHPGEKTEVASPELYEVCLRERAALLRAAQEAGIWILEEPSVRGADLTGASDLSVFTGGGPTDSITAAYRRVPMMYLAEKAPDTLGKQVVGTSSWFVADRGAMEVVPKLADLADALKSLDPEGLRRRQEKAFPLPDDWNTSGAYVDFVEEVLRAKKAP